MPALVLVQRQLQQKCLRCNADTLKLLPALASLAGVPVSVKHRSLVCLTTALSSRQSSLRPLRAAEGMPKGGKPDWATAKEKATVANRSGYASWGGKEEKQMKKEVI